MTQIFDGLADLHRKVFGASVTIFPGGATDGTVITAIFRDRPTATGGEFADGDVMQAVPTLRLGVSDAAGLVAGDLVTPGDGKTYRIVQITEEGSPAADGMIVAELELSETP